MFHSMDDATEIRRAGGGDAPELARLLHDFNTEFEEPTPGVAALTRHVSALLAGDDAVALLAFSADPPAFFRPEGEKRQGGRGAGLALVRLLLSVWTGEPEAHLQELYVVPGLRGRGIGRALLEEAMAAARAEGATWIDLGTGETDTAARALYESAGFSNREGGPDGPAMLFYEREL
jgi:ribosomal protein S18 acetylase RimI-like enzyme